MILYEGREKTRGSVGTGRRARLRILWQQCRVGSSPIFRTIKSKKESGRRPIPFFAFRSRRLLEPGRCTPGSPYRGCRYAKPLSGPVHRGCTRSPIFRTNFLRKSLDACNTSATLTLLYCVHKQNKKQIKWNTRGKNNEEN